MIQSGDQTRLAAVIQYWRSLNAVRNVRFGRMARYYAVYPHSSRDVGRQMAEAIMTGP